MWQLPKPDQYTLSMIEVLTAVCALIVLAVFGPTYKCCLVLLLTYTLIALTFIDFDTQLLPDRYTLPLAALGLGVNSYAIYTSPTSEFGVM